MIIEQPEAFKTWLTAVLRPMCDADPAALAKYVLALIKKDKSEEELQKIMVGQLEVFLENETESFVNLVLRTLETQDYITTPVIPNTNPPNPMATVKPPLPTTTTTTAKETKTIVPPSELPNLSETVNGSNPPSSTTTTTTTTTKREHESSKRDRDLRKTDFEKEERSRIRSRHRSSSRNRSRSRSWDRSRRSKSRDLYRDSKRSRTMSNRNKSPPLPSSSSSSSRRYDRRRSRTPPSPRSPKYRSRYRNRTPPTRSLTRSRSRSLPPPSIEKRERRDSNKDLRTREHSRPDTPTQDSNHGDTDFRLTNTTQSIQSVIVQQQQSQQQQQQQQQQTTKRRCRDFDEKGYCMRGEMCPFDHGIDPVVLEDSALSSVLTTNGTNTTNNGTNDLTTTQTIGGHPVLSANTQRIIPPEYNPQAPQIWNRPGFRGGPRPLPNMPRGPLMGNFPPSQPNLQRELIPVPVMDNNKQPEPYNNIINNGTNFRHPTPFNNNHGNNNNNNMMIENDQINYNHHQHHQHHHNNNNSNNNNKKKSFDFNRLGPRSMNHHHHHHHHNNNNNNNHLSGNMNNNNNNKINYPTNSSLELRKIPQGLNTITHLNNHFSKFGKPINIQVNYDGDPEAAIITFSSHAEANAAYRSTEAVLNNRFIKVFWHNTNNNNNTNNDGKQENIPPSRSVKERLGIPAIVPPNTNKVLNLVQTTTTTTTKINDENTENNNNNVNTDITGDKLKTINNNNSKDEKAQQAAAIKKNQELLAVKEKLKKNQDEQRKEVIKMKNSLRKRKQELLEKQLSQQKVLIEKMEKLPLGPQRDLILETIKKTQESIEETKKDLLQSVLIVKTTQQQQLQQQPIVVLKKKEDVQREMLDAELDLITKQQEGADTTEIQKRIIELRAKAALTTTPTILTTLQTTITTPTIIRGRGGGGGGNGGSRLSRRFNPISRHLLTKNNLIDGGNSTNTTTGVKSNLKSVNKAFQKHTVDHRPTRLLVSGYEADEQDSVLSHFQSFGEIVDYTTDATLPSITLNYKTRKEAEMALLKGKHFQDRTLSITWSITTTTITHHQTNPITTTVTTNDSQQHQQQHDDKQEQQQHQQDDEQQKQQSQEINVKRTTLETPLSEPDEDQLIEQHLQSGEGEEDLIGPEISEEALLQDDEEEEEENEDRSWRR